MGVKSGGHTVGVGSRDLMAISREALVHQALFLEHLFDFKQQEPFMAIDIADLEGFDAAEKAQDEIEVGGDFAPRLHNKDKERMADANVPFTLTLVDHRVSEPTDKFKRKKSKDGEEAYYWHCEGYCDRPLEFAAVPGQNGRDTSLKLEAGEAFSFILSGIAKREPVMRKLYDALLDGAEIKNVTFTILEYLGNGQPILSLGRWRELATPTATPQRPELVAAPQQG